MTGEFEQPDTEKPADDQPPADSEKAKPKRKRGRPRGSRTKRSDDDETVRAGGWRLGDHGWEPDT